MSAILAVDQGTSGTKSVVVAEDGTVLAVEEVPVHPSYGEGGAVEQDPEALWQSILHAGSAAVHRAGVPIEAVSLANQGESVLAWDERTGKPLTPIIVWQDRRAESVCDELRDRAEEVSERTGLPLDSYFSAPKMAWIRRNLTTDGVVTTSDSWIIHRLTGAFVTDASTASRSLAFDLEQGRWDAELTSMFGLDSVSLPRIVGSDEVVGETSQFGEAVPVAGLIVDQQAALAAEGCLVPGEAKCTFGTGAFLLANTGSEPRPSAAGLSASVAWRLRGKDTYCLDGQVYTAASAVRWLIRLGLIGSAAELDSVAAGDAAGVISVPALGGLGAPWWRRDATASFRGMTLATGREHLVRAVLDGVAATVAELVDAISNDLGRPLKSLRVDGGLTRSRVLMQAVADLTQLPVELYPSAHATPLGSAAFARLALDSKTSLADAVVPWAASETFAPRWSAEQADEFRARWRVALERG